MKLLSVFFVCLFVCLFFYFQQVDTVTSNVKKISTTCITVTGPLPGFCTGVRMSATGVKSRADRRGV